MIDFSTLPITPDSARAARNYLGLNQQQAATQSDLPVHKIKRFETGNYVPDTKFLQDLKEFYEGQGYEFPDQAKPGANAKATGLVLPQGAIEDDESIPVGKPQVHQVQHIRIDPSLSDEQIGNILDHIERNEEVIARSRNTKVESGLFDGLSDSSEALHGQSIRLLAENGSLIAKLFGRVLVDAPTPELLSGKARPKTHGELLTHTMTHVHAAISGDKDTITKHKSKKAPTSLIDAIFG